MFFKHPLFWKEWKTAKWWSALMGSMFLVMFLSVSNSLSRTYAEYYGQGDVISTYVYRLNHDGRVFEPIFLRIFYNSFSALSVFLLPVIIIMSMMLFQSDRKENIGMFMSSLPFTKKEQFSVKWVVGILAITIPFILALGAAMLIRQSNIDWITRWYGENEISGILAYETVSILLRMMAQTYLFMVAFFSVLMLMQSLIANNIAASIIGSITLAAPWFILEAGRGTISRIFDNYSLRLYNVNRINFYTLMFSSSHSNWEAVTFSEGVAYINPVISQEHYLLKIVIVVAITVIAIYGGLKFYEKNDNSRNGYLLMFPWVGKILVPGVTLCSGLLGNNLINQFIGNKSVSYEIVTLIVSGLIGYLMVTKMIGVSEKHGV